MSEARFTKLVVRIPAEWHRQIRILAAERDTTIAALVQEALRRLLAEAGRLPDNAERT